MYDMAYQANDFKSMYHGQRYNSKHIYIMNINYLCNKQGYKYQSKK
jgi:hypothetical protein